MDKIEWTRQEGFPNSAPPVVMLPGPKPSWTLYTTMQQFKTGDHHELFSEDDPIVPVLFHKGCPALVVATYTNLDEVFLHCVRALETVNTPRTRMNVYARNWPAKDLIDCVNRMTADSEYRFNIHIGSEFSMTEEYRHLYPKF
jgi:hypothetical protein